MLFVLETYFAQWRKVNCKSTFSPQWARERTVILPNQGLWIPHPSAASALCAFLTERCHMASSPRALSPGSQTQVNVMLLWNCKSHLESSYHCCSQQWRVLPRPRAHIYHPSMSVWEPFLFGVNAELHGSQLASPYWKTLYLLQTTKQ